MTRFLWRECVILFSIFIFSSALNCSSDPCMYGICLDTSNSSYSCYCIDGYTGINCEINWDDCWSNPCLNGGNCSDGVASYNCSCPDNFIGINCEQKFSECLNQPCLNNGTCIDYNGFTCQCQEGYSGEYCEIDVSVCNNTICKNFGECVDGPGYSFSCKCRDGWAGEFCEEDVDECFSSPCQNGGLCLNVPGTYTCACLFGFTGKDCDKNIVACDQNPCQNGAMCLLEDSQTTCYCVPDYHGPLCELKYNDCESKFAKCENGGTCVDGINNFTCTCPASYEGFYCQDYNPTPTVPFYFNVTEPTTSTVSQSPKDVNFTTVTPQKVFSEELTTKASDVSTSPRFFNDSTERATTLASDRSTSTKDSSPSDQTSSPFDTTTPVFQVPEMITMKSSTFSTSETSSSFADTPKTTTSSWTIENITRPDTTFSSDDKTPRFFVPTSPFPATKDDFNQTTISSPPPLAPVNFTQFTLPTERFTTPGPVNTSSEASPCISTSQQCNCTESKDCKRSSISNAAFNGKSYIRQQVNIDDNGVLKILLTLKTKSKGGIIIHAFFDEERYILLYMEFGQLKFQFSCGLQTMLLGEIDAPINNGFDVDIEMKFRYLTEDKIGKCSAQLYVNKTMAMSGEQMLSSHEDIPKQAKVHLGGIPQAFTHYFSRIALGFIGCMSLLKVNDVERHFIEDSVETFQIEQCTSFLCLLNPCRNFGSCHDIDGKVYCKCLAGYTGDRCEKTACDNNPCYLGATCISSPGTGFICVCPLGMHGLRCEEESLIVQPSFSVFIPGFSSYVAYGINTVIKDNMELKMRIIPHSVDQISLIAFMGQSGANPEISDHFAITYVKGYIMLTWDLGSGVRRIFTKTPLSSKSHRPQTIQVGRQGRQAWLFVDGVGNFTDQAAGTMTQLDVSPILYIGGHKSMNFETLPHDLPLHTGFSGCIFDFELKSNNKIFQITKTSPATGRGVGECHRNECTHNSCKNGAVCLNHGPTYSCICMKDWEGPECSETRRATMYNY